MEKVVSAAPDRFTFMVVAVPDEHWANICKVNTKSDKEKRTILLNKLASRCLIIQSFIIGINE